MISQVQENSGIFKDVPHVRVRYDYSYDGVMRSFEDSRRRLGLDRIDILFEDRKVATVTVTDKATGVLIEPAAASTGTTPATTPSRTKPPAPPVARPPVIRR